MNVQEIRQKHDTFTYREFDVKIHKDILEIFFRFNITPDIEFTPKINLPLNESIYFNDKEIGNLAFHLGLIEAVSYWKSTCSPHLVVEAGYLTLNQIKWWHDLFIHGLGEFYFRNKIDFTDPTFLTISSSDQAPAYPVVRTCNSNGDLILVGGGKDSITSLDILKEKNKRYGVMLLNPTKAALNTVQLAGINNPLIVKRTIDQRLLELNASGYLNAHTPFSAYLSFLASFVGALHGYEHVIASNEASAEEGNIRYLGIEINHQYSKSYRYEKLFKQYAEEFLLTGLTYFSFLRPLYELQIAALFSRKTQYDYAFSSCNESRNNYWCGKCPKCAFVYLILNPFMDPQRVQSIFGKKDFFEDFQIQKHITDLVGLGEHKPFECVGTEQESRLAIAMTIFRYKRYGMLPPPHLVSIDNQLGLTRNTTETELFEKISTDWFEAHSLPLEYSELLQRALKMLKV